MSPTLSIKAVFCGAMVLFAVTAFVRTAHGEAKRGFVEEHKEQTFIYLDGGKDIITYVGQATLFKWYAVHPFADDIEFKWDFDGDGTFDFSKIGRAGQILQTTYIYDIEGTYTAMLKATVPYGEITPAYDYVQVTAKTGYGTQASVEESKLEITIPEPIASDGVTERHAVMINGGYETRFWIDVNFTYNMLIEHYNYTPDRIYLLNHNGINPDGQKPNNMIDFAATKSNIAQVFNNLASTLDEDDFLFFWSTDHAGGYFGPGTEYYGFTYHKPEIDPGDELDYLESDFKLRSFFTGGYYSCNHGMEVWKVRYDWHPVYNCYNMYRNKYVSTFSDIYFEAPNASLSDYDIFIECFIDLLLGDTNRNGYVETGTGEVYDYDGDGNPPYDPVTETFDEGDWGSIDYYYDDITDLNTVVPGNTYVIFDYGLDNRVDLDINYDPGNLEVDATDIDNQGLFDGVDVNDDGDMDDSVSIDESISLYSSRLFDDELKFYLATLNPQVTVVFLEPCFSGGFVWDLSGPSRVICTATVEEDVSWGNDFVRAFTSALHGENEFGYPVNADQNGDDKISIVEAFNYAAENDYTGEVPQYEDNGDGTSHAYPIPNAGDGPLGSMTFLTGVIFTRGDCNADGILDIHDIVYQIDYLYNSGLPPSPLEAGDANCDGTINSADVVYLINYLFVGGPPPCE